MTNDIRLKKYYMIFIVVIMFLVGFIAGNTFIPRNTPVEYSQPDLREERAVSMLMPAIDTEGNGVIGTLLTTVKPGSGKILLDTSKVLNYIDTQLSGRIAAEAASRYAKVNLSSIDIVYTVKVNASLVEGPSAGASMALSVLLALDNKTSGDITITGTISPDGSIGKVGSILEKARIAKASGVKVFLVPKDQSNVEDTKRDKICNYVNALTVCKITYVAEKISLEKYLNITVREVGTLGEAYYYFTMKRETI
ncbi:MAG: S16 family serine protease [Candidatus Aenigmatarchaeota archaeon]